MSKYQNNTSKGENFIFLISQPRSGSTLLQLMLSGSPEIATTSEPWIALHPIFGLHDYGIESIYNSNLAKAALVDFLKQSGIDREFYRAQINIFLTALYNQAMEYQGKKYFLDKTPRYYHILNDIVDLFPEAKIIILIRNPLAVLNSMLRTWIKDDIAAFINIYEDLIIGPEKLVNFLEMYPDRYILVNYENLVSNTKKTLIKICHFIKVKYSDNMINYGKRLNSDWKFGDSYGVRKATFPIKNSLNKWKEEFDTPVKRSLALSYIEMLGKSLILKMGYSDDDLRSSINVDSTYHSRYSHFFLEAKKIIEGLASTRTIRKAALESILEIKKNCPNKNSQIFEEDRIIKTVIKNSTQSEIRNLRAEINSLIDQRNRMENSLSWKITGPLRNSKILQGALKLIKKNTE